MGVLLDTYYWQKDEDWEKEQSMRVRSDWEKKEQQLADSQFESCLRESAVVYHHRRENGGAYLPSDDDGWSVLDCWTGDCWKVSQNRVTNYALNCSECSKPRRRCWQQHPAKRQFDLTVGPDTGDILLRGLAQRWIADPAQHQRDKEAFSDVCLEANAPMGQPVHWAVEAECQSNEYLDEGGPPCADAS